jgi:hypothetical protein
VKARILIKREEGKYFIATGAFILYSKKSKLFCGVICIKRSRFTLIQYNVEDFREYKAIPKNEAMCLAPHLFSFNEKPIFS